MEFDGDDERHQARQALFASDAYGALWEVDQTLRRMIKSNESGIVQIDQIVELRAMIREAVTLDDLMC